MSYTPMQSTLDSFETSDEYVYTRNVEWAKKQFNNGAVVEFEDWIDPDEFIWVPVRFNDKYWSVPSVFRVKVK